MEKDEVEVSGNRCSALPFFLIGAATGIALAVLLAPRSGAATRRLISRTVQEGEDWMRAKATAAQDYVKGHGADLRERVKEVAEVIGRSSAQPGR
jgi:gas vesicle protein